MDANTLIDDSSSGQELRYVTVHFRDMQGLRMAPYWAALLVLAEFAKRSIFKGWLTWAAIGLTTLQFGWLYVSGRWYERRYGVVEQPEPPVPSQVISILHPETRPTRANRNWGALSGQSAVLSLIWGFGLLPGIFSAYHHGGRNFALGYFAALTAVYQVFPRCLYPLTKDWSVVLRRELAVIAMIVTITSICIEYQFAQTSTWNWMIALFSMLLSLDLYDHWLFNHLLSRGPAEGTHE